ncbi:MAG: hypothetical protein JXB10_05270 [Pirellulales bacterium]|nr:hypothetical protein [Pirellulales bacterium]
MPRILPFFGALLTIAGAIGWNIARYPVVWEMVGPPADFPLSASAGPPAIAVQPAQPEPVPSAEPSPPETPVELPIAAIESPPPPIAPAAPIVPVTVERQPQPLAAVPAPKYAASHEADCQLAESQESAGKAGWQSAPQSKPSLVSSALVRRLPPVDAEAPPPRSLNAEAEPPYPSTGF